MKEEKKKFVLKHTFENVDSLRDEYSPNKKHFGYEWSIRVKHNDNNFGVYLHRRTTEEDLPPVTVSSTFLMVSHTLNERIERKFDYTFSIPTGYGWDEFAKWENIQKSYTKENKFTVEIHVEIVKVFHMSTNIREFTIKHTLKNTTELTRETSPVESHFGAPWELLAKRENDKLYFNLKCKMGNKSNLWFIDSKFTFKVKKTNGGVIEAMRAITFNRECNASGFVCFLEWKEIIEKCMTNNELTLEVHVTILNMIGICQKRKMNFDEEDEQLTDICLVVDGKKFYVSKVILAQFSPVFKAMFYGNFAESKSKEVEIKDTDSKTFEVFLSILHGEKVDITFENVEHLLILADRFDVPKVMQKCEKTLLSLNCFVEKKLELAERFNLPDLQEQALDSLKKPQQVKALHEKMKDMGAKTKDALFDKAMSFIK